MKDNKLIIKSFGIKIFEQDFDDADDLKEIKLPRGFKLKF